MIETLIAIVYKTAPGHIVAVLLIVIFLQTRLLAIRRDFNSRIDTLRDSLSMDLKKRVENEIKYANKLLDTKIIGAREIFHLEMSKLIDRGQK